MGQLIGLGRILAGDFLLERCGDQAGRSEPFGFDERILGRGFHTELTRLEGLHDYHDAANQESGHHDEEEHGQNAVEIGVGQRCLGIGQCLASQLSGVDLGLPGLGRGEIADLGIEDLLEVGGEGHGHVPHQRHRNPCVLGAAHLDHAYRHQHEAGGGK